MKVGIKTLTGKRWKYVKCSGRVSSKRRCIGDIGSRDNEIESILKFYKKYELPNAIISEKLNQVGYEKRIYGTRWSMRTRVLFGEN